MNLIWIMILTNIKYIFNHEMNLQFESTLTETLTIKNDVHEVKRFSEFMKSAIGKLNVDTSLARQLRLAVEEAVVKEGGIIHLYLRGRKEAGSHLASVHAGPCK